MNKREIERVWRSLLLDSGGKIFHPNMVEDVTEPGRRFLLRAIAAGTPLAESVELEMTGRFRTRPNGSWMPMRARQVLSRSGFLWLASMGGLIRLSGYDSYFEGEGEMRWMLWGLIPVVGARGADISRSARGRLVAEMVAWLPPALLPEFGAVWTAVDENTARVRVVVDGEPVEVTITVEEDGRIRSLELERWGNPGTGNDKGFALQPFGGTCGESCAFNGYTVPTRILGGWYPGEERRFEFFEAKLTAARYGASFPAL